MDLIIKVSLFFNTLGRLKICRSIKQKSSSFFPISALKVMPRETPFAPHPLSWKFSFRPCREGKVPF